MTTESECYTMGDFCLFPPNSEFRDVQSTEQPTKFIINVSGLRFETYKHTVEQLPDSVLGSASKRNRYWDAETSEFFFDRNRTCFEAILTYYQTKGILIRPATVPMNIFVNELKFFELGQEALWKATEGYNGFEEQYEKPKNKLQCKVWELFEHPDTSNAARGIAILSITIILLSVVLFCIETLPSFQENKTKGNGTNEDEQDKDRYTSGPFIIEAACISWFTIEYVVRLLSSPNKWKFVTSILNIIDLIAIIPFYISIAMTNTETDVSSLAILRVVRLVRVFRIFKLSRYSRGLQILGHTLRASVKELGLLLFFLCVGIILFSSAIYYAELGSNDKFVSIPDSFWWSIITMTTVGYGDYVPVTGVGKLVGCFCAITGVLFIALPVPVIVSNFAYYYSKERNRQMTREINPEEGSTVSSNTDVAVRSLIRCPSVNNKNGDRRRKFKNGKIVRERGMDSFTEKGGAFEVLPQNNNSKNSGMDPNQAMESNV